MNITNDHKEKLQKMLMAIIENLKDDLNNEELSEHSGAILSKELDDLVFIGRMIEESKW